MSKPPAREQAQVNIRMPDDLRDRIKAAADANNRSMNAEIVAALEDKFPAPTPVQMTVHDMFQYLQAAPTRAERLARLDEVNRLIADMLPELEPRFEQKRPGHMRLHFGKSPDDK
ncbi:Arc family DNA-binding protein [Paracoccus sp. YIM 132242]|uniref:Arc family DNA-binding protein n=1 Tax=Paracoccus lichenicola TaxID=2665644 RepID=A0A6L6HJA3_9RHOB|nr:Arc family DNA-binding protein [Paracoccus lichenicola]MTD99266.1 Arc family DNA-binding protein [Paracoccus lichenicola]